MLRAYSLWLIILGSITQAGFAAEVAEQTSAKIADVEIASVASMLKARAKDQYMVVPNCQPVAIPGWESFGASVKRCVYNAKDGARKPSVPLPVVLHITPWDRVARWLISACHSLGLKTAKERGSCISRLDSHINGQSNYQFPVAGLVDESFNEGVGCKSENCYFTFRNGIAVRMPKFGVWEYSTEENKTVWKRIRRKFDLAKEGDAIALYSGDFKEPGKYARISGTTRGQLVEWQKAMRSDLLVGTDVMDGEGFPHLIRKLYQAAQSRDESILISAWALSNKSCLVIGGDCCKPDKWPKGKRPSVCD